MLIHLYIVSLILFTTILLLTVGMPAWMNWSFCSEEYFLSTSFLINYCIHSRWLPNVSLLLWQDVLNWRVFLASSDGMEGPICVPLPMTWICMLHCVWKEIACFLSSGIDMHDRKRKARLMIQILNSWVVDLVMVIVSCSGAKLYNWMTNVV
jgi:hypothetical protein